MLSFAMMFLDVDKAKTIHTFVLNVCVFFIMFLLLPGLFFHSSIPCILWHYGSA